MELSELFVSLKEKIPFQFDKCIPFHQNLHKEFENYLKDLRTLDKNEFANLFCKDEKDITLRKFITIENKICKKIEKIILDVRNGDSYTAYRILRPLLENKIENLSDKLYGYFKIDFSGKQKHSYRVRNIDTQKGEVYLFPNSMKHCPFQNVHNLGNYRFSISGFPCLYLGSSAKVCEVETPKQEGKEYHKVMFELKNNPKKPLLLNLVPPIDSSNSQELFKFLLLFPFYLACLSRKKHEEGKFHPEYIIPQLLLLFVRKEELLDGIKYLSTHTTEKDNRLDMINYVFPVEQVKNEGFDKKLDEKFDIKEIK